MWDIHIMKKYTKGYNFGFFFSMNRRKFNFLNSGKLKSFIVALKSTQNRYTWGDEVLTYLLVQLVIVLQKFLMPMNLKFLRM